MQFTLRSMFLIVTGLALFCGAVFSLPVAATGWVLAITLLLSPAVWVSGASFGTGGKQAFFRGGIVCGTVPFVVSCYCLTTCMGVSVSAIYSMAATPAVYPVYSSPQPTYAPQPPVSSSPNPLGPVAPSDGPDTSDSNSDGSPTSDAASPNPWADPAPTLIPGPQTVYASEVAIAPSYGVPAIYYDPYTATTQMIQPVKPTYAQTLRIRFLLAAIWLAPGFFSFCGGVISYGTYRLLRPAALAVDIP